MKIKNLTPHPVTILLGTTNETIVVFPSVGLARLSQSIESREPIYTEYASIPTSESVFGEATGLPDPVEGVFLIVSQMIKSVLPHRADLLVPSEIVRDPSGAILGCQSLGR